MDRYISGWTILFFVFVGFLLVYLSLPRTEEWGLIYLRNKQFQRAYGTYQELLQREDKEDDINVVMPLIELHLLFGNAKEAIRLMEKMAIKYPTREAYEKLASLYEADNRPLEAISLYEKIAQTNPTLPVLLKLAAYYRHTGESQKEMEALEKAVTLGEKKPFYILSLGKLFSYYNRPEEALELSKKISLQEMDIDTIDFFILLNLREKKKEAALAFAQKAIQEKSLSQPEILRIAERFHLEGYSSLGFTILEPYLATSSASSILTPAIIVYGLTDPTKKNLIFRFMETLINKNLLPPTMYPVFFQLSIDYKDPKSVLLGLDKLGIDRLSNEEILNLFSFALVENPDLLLEKIRVQVQKFPEPLDEDLQVALALTDKNTSPQLIKENILKKYQAKEITSAQVIRFIDLFLQLNAGEEAKELFAAINNIEDLTPNGLNTYIFQSVSLNEPEVGLEALEKWRSISSSREKLRLDAVGSLYAALGNDDEILNFLERYPERASSLFDIAFKYKHPSTMFIISAFWYQQTASKKAMAALALSSFANKDIEAGLALIDKLGDINTFDKDLLQRYFYALMAAGVEVPSLQDRLDALIAAIMANKELSDKTKEEWGWGLIDLGMKPTARLYFRSLAEVQDEFGSALETYFYLLPKEWDPGDQKWILEKAKQSSDKDREKWFKAFLDYQQYPLLLEIASKKDFHSWTMTKQWMEALLALYQRKDFLDVATSYLEQNKDPKIAEEMAGIYFTTGFIRQSFQLYLSLYCNHLLKEQKSIGQMIKSGFYAGAVDRVSSFLMPYILKNPDDFTALAIGAAVSDLKGFEKRALYTYVEIFQDLLGKKDLDDRMLRYEALFNAGFIHTALEEIYENSLTAEGDEKFALQKLYAEKLLSAQYFWHALRYLRPLVAEAKKNPPKDPARYDQLLILLAQAERETGLYHSAMVHVIELLNIVENPAPSLLLAGVIHNDLARWQQSVGFFAEGLRQSPYNEPAVDGLLTVWWPERTFHKSSIEERNTGQTLNEHLFKDEQQIRWNINWISGWYAEGDHVNSGTTQNPVTGVSSFYEGSRWRGGLFTRRDFASGSFLQGDLQFRDHRIGGMFTYRRAMAKGYDDFEVKLNSPSWDLVESTVYRGTLSSVKWERKWSFHPRLQAIGSMVWRLWSIQSAFNGAHSCAFSYYIDQILDGPFAHATLGTGGFWRLNYNLDAEYVTYLLERNSPFVPEPFAPMPVSSREVHTVKATLYKPLYQHLYAEAFLGFGWNRLGSSGPTLGLYLIYFDPRCIEARLEADRSVSTTTAGSVQRITFSLRMNL